MKKIKNLGVPLLQSAVSMIPGVGPLASTLVPGIVDSLKTPEQQKSKTVANSSNVYGDIQPLVTPDMIPPASANGFVDNPMAQPNIPLADGNMFVDNTRPPLEIDPLPVYQDIGIQIPGQKSDLATDSTPMNQGQELTLGTNLSEQGITNPLEVTSDARSTLSTDGIANGLALGLKGAALIGSIYDASQPSEKERLITPNYNKADNYMREANIDYTQASQDAIGVSNISGETNRSLASNAASFQGREQARLSNLQDALGRIAMAEENGNSQLNLTKGQYEANKAVDTANRQYQNSVDNLQNEATARSFDRSLMSDFSQIANSLNQFGETQKIIKNNQQLNQFQLNQQLAILNSKFPNFKIDNNVIELLKSGASIDDIVKIK